MEQQPQPHGGAQPPEVNSYGIDDPATQARIEQARAEASEQRRQDRARLEQLVELGLSPDDAETVIELEASQRQHINQETDAAIETETSPRYQPRVYVADLASLERGIQHGLWIDANQYPDDLDADIAAMLDSSPTVGARAWAVRGAEDFAGYDVTGLSSTDLLSRLGRGVADYGEAFAAYADWAGTDSDTLDRFSHHYCGTFASPEEWGRHEADVRGWHQQIDEQLDEELRPYVRIDYATWAREASVWWYAVEGDDGLHVFSP